MLKSIVNNVHVNEYDLVLKLLKHNFVCCAIMQNTNKKIIWKNIIVRVAFTRNIKKSQSNYISLTKSKKVFLWKQILIECYIILYLVRTLSCASIAYNHIENLSIISVLYTETTLTAYIWYLTVDVKVLCLGYIHTHNYSWRQWLCIHV